MGKNSIEEFERIGDVNSGRFGGLDVNDVVYVTIGVFSAVEFDLDYFAKKHDLGKEIGRESLARIQNLSLTKTDSFSLKIRREFREQGEF